MLKIFDNKLFVEIVTGTIIILMFSGILSYFIYKHKHTTYLEIPKYSYSEEQNSETIERLENILYKLNQEVETGKINIELLSAQKKLVETYLNSLKVQEYVKE